MLLCTLLFSCMPFALHAFYSEADLYTPAGSKKAVQQPSYYIQAGLIPIAWWTRVEWLNLPAYKGDTLYGGVVLVRKDAARNYHGEYRASDNVTALPRILCLECAQKYYDLAVETFQS